MVAARKGPLSRTIHIAFVSVILLGSIVLNQQSFPSTAHAAEDTTAPTFSLQEGEVVVAESVTLTITEDELDSVTLDGVADTPFTGSAPSYMVDVSGQGQHTVVATDASGNSSELHFTLDKEPTVTLDDIAPVVEGQDVAISGIIDDPDITEATLFIDGNAAATNISVSNGAFAATISGLSAGSYTITVSAKDALQHEGTSAPKTALVTVPPDTIPPAITLEPISSVVAGSAITVSGTVEPGVTVLYITVDGVLLSDTATAASDGTFSFQIAGLSVGTHTVSLSALDAAGNQGTSSIRNATIYAPSGSGTDDDTTTSDTTKEVAVAADTDTSRYFLAPQVSAEAQAALDRGVNNDNSAVPSAGDTGAAAARTLAATSDTAVPSESRGGLAWYWWVAIAAGAIVVWLTVRGVIRAIGRGRSA